MINTKTILLALLLSTLLLVLNGPSTVNAITWSTPVEVPAQTDFDVIPSVTEDVNGKIWLAYQSVNQFNPPEIYVKVFSGITWTNEELVSADPTTDDTSPVIFSLGNGTLLLFWASKRSGNFDIVVRSNNQGAWSPERVFISTTSDESNPTGFQDKNGVIWVVWHRRVATTNFDLFYRTYTGASWSAESPLTTDSSFDMLPSITQTKDGKVWVVWSSFRTGDWQVWYKTFDGTTWSPDTRLTKTSSSDLDPTTVQDRDGTLWVFWSRVINVPPPKDFEEDIYYKTSLDNGATWSADTPLTNTLDFDDINPVVGQLIGKRLWIFWSSDMPSSTSFNIFYMASNPITTHDLGIAKLEAPSKIKRGDTPTVNVTVTNFGDFIENAQVTLQANSTTIGTASVTLIDSETKKISLTWNTLNEKAGRYILTATITVATGETLANQADNTVKLGPIRLCPRGDVDGDCDVDIIDIAIVAKAFGTKPGDALWDPRADLNKDGKVDIIDIAIVAVDFGVKVS